MAFDPSPAIIAVTRGTHSRDRNVADECGRAERLLSGLVHGSPGGSQSRTASGVLGPGGSIWLFENDAGGDFIDLRDPDSRGCGWDRVVRLVEHHGFEVTERVETVFDFSDETQAKRVLGRVWGDGPGGAAEAPD